MAFTINGLVEKIQYKYAKHIHKSEETRMASKTDIITTSTTKVDR